MGDRDRDIKVGDFVKVIKVSPDWHRYTLKLEDCIGKVGKVTYDEREDDDDFESEDVVSVDFLDFTWCFPVRWLRLAEAPEAVETKPALEYEVFPSLSTERVIRITSQRYRGDDFTVSGDMFKSSVGLYLGSRNCPAYENETNTVFLRGVNGDCDNDVIIFPSKSLLTDFITAAREYNASFVGAGKEEDEDKKHLSLVKANLVGWLEDFNVYKDQVKTCSTPDQYMKAKRKIVQYAINLPLIDSFCFHCMKHALSGVGRRACSVCEYGKEHGICLDSDSDWHKLKKAVQTTMELAEKY